MRRLELALVVVVFFGGCSAASNVATTEQPIVGGVPTTGYPFVGYVSSDYGGGTSSGCTGTLIRDKWVLTASHCIEETDGKVMGVKVTFEADADHATMWHTAKSWQQHPQYGKPVPPDDQYYINRGYDCALIELNEAVTGVTPIPYGSFAMDTSYVGKPVTQIGYGFTDGNGNGSGIKRMLGTTIGDVHDGVLGLDDKDGTGTCQGDSGGPTLWDAGGGVTDTIGVSSYGSAGCPGGGFMSRTELCAAWLDTVAGPFATAPDMATSPADMAMSGGGGSGGGGSGGSGGGGDEGGGGRGGGNGGSGGGGGDGTGGNGDNGTGQPHSGCEFAGGAIGRNAGGFGGVALFTVGFVLLARRRRRAI